MADYSRVHKMVEGDASSDLRQHLEATTVHITWDGSDLYLDAVQLLIENVRKLPVNITLDPHVDTGVFARLQSVADGIDPDRPLVPAVRDAEAIHAHVGTEAPAGASLCAVPDGHGVRLRASGAAVPTPLAPPTGLGSVLAASVFASEVFRAAAFYADTSAHAALQWDFDPVALGHPTGATPGLPPLERTALIGCGAIGTAIVRILSLLETEGELTVVDPQAFDVPNVMTYSLGDRHDAARGVMKTALVRAALPNLQVTTLELDAAAYIEQLDDGEAPAPRIVVNGLDSIEARHDANRTRADVILDASTGGAHGTTVGLRKAFHDGPCLRCYYTDPARPAIDLATATGLPARVLADGDHELTEEDIAGAHPDVQPRLAPLRGQRVCALIRLLDLVPGAGDYDAAAAFVAQQAAALAVGALIRTTNGQDITGGYEAEYNVLHGWNADAQVPRSASRSCDCQTQSALIQQVRAHRLRQV